jgi:hypothetical protein
MFSKNFSGSLVDIRVCKILEDMRSEAAIKAKAEGELNKARELSLGLLKKDCFMRK